MYRCLFFIFCFICCSTHLYGFAQENSISSDKERIAREGKSEDFDIRGIKTTMTVDEIIKYADGQGWNHIIIPNVFSSLIICPKAFDCSASLRGEPSGSFRIDIVYADNIIYEIRYSTYIKATFEEVSKLILDKYGKPLKSDPESENSYCYGMNTKALKDNHQMEKYRNFIGDHIMMLSLRKDKDQGVPNGQYQIGITLYNPPKIDPETQKPLQPAL